VHEVGGASIHESSVVDRPCRIGTGTRIWHYCHIMPDARIGAHCTLGQNVFVGRGVRIGDHVKIQNNVSVFEGVTLEDDVFCGPSVVFTNVVNPRSEIARKDQYRPTLVRRGATVGANATILCGHTIGPYAFVGAGAVVTRDVPAYALVVGNPARRTGWVCRCGVRLPAGPTLLRCPECRATYRRRGARLEAAGTRAR
jgi:UDP-2-acetamido-3-amino-2,3-dideoxy-glucuronate N-acetyltransferase